MFWRTPLTLTETDVKLIVSKALPQVEKELNEPVYVTTTDSLISQSVLLVKLEKRVLESESALSVVELADFVGLNIHIIEPLLLKITSKNQLFFDGSKVITPKLIDSLKTSVKEITEISEFCSTNNLTIKSAEHIFRKSTDFMVLDSVIVPEGVVQDHLVKFNNQLENATKPIKYSEIEHDARLLQVLKKRLGVQLHDTVYIPTSFVNTEVLKAQQLLETNKFVNLNDFAIVKQQVTKSLLNQNEVLLGHYIVSQDLITESKRTLDFNLNKHMWFDTRDLPLQPYIAQYLIETSNLNKLQSKNKPAILVKPQLEKVAVKMVCDLWEVKINKQVDEFDFGKLDGGSSVSLFVDKINLPTIRDVQDGLLELNVPTEINLSNQITPQVRLELVNKGRKLIEPKFEQGLQKSEAKVRAYLNGLISLESDSTAFNMAWEEFQQYVGDKQFATPERVSVAKSQFVASDELLKVVLNELKQNAILKLNKLSSNEKTLVKNAASILHLAVVIYHSRTMCPNGFLKIRGKAVPRIMKMFEFPQSFTSLKANIKQPTMELINQVKADALG